MTSVSIFSNKVYSANIDNRNLEKLEETTAKSKKCLHKLQIKALNLTNFSYL